MNVDPNARPRAKSIVRNWIYSDANAPISTIGGTGGVQNIERMRRMHVATKRGQQATNYSQMLDQAMADNEYYRNEFRLHNDIEETNDPNADQPQYDTLRPLSGHPPQYNRSNELFDRRQPPPSNDPAERYDQNQFGNSSNQLFHRKR
jgi:hypothetical protein